MTIWCGTKKKKEKKEKKKEDNYDDDGDDDICADMNLYGKFYNLKMSFSLCIFTFWRIYVCKLY